MSTTRTLTLLALLALGACTTPPHAPTTIQKTDTTPAQGGIYSDGPREATGPTSGTYYGEPSAPSTAPSTAPAVTQPRPSGGSVRDIVNSYPEQR